MDQCLSVELSPECELMRAVYILCHMMMRVIDRTVEPHGLTGSRWHLLIVVRDSGEPLTITQLSERLFLSPQNVSRMISALEEDGLVTRDTSGPGRTVRIGLTEPGRTRVDACAELADTCGRSMLGEITPDQTGVATEVLEQMIRNTINLERGTPPAPPTPRPQPQPTDPAGSHETPGLSDSPETRQ
jgi:DNA-binding MarR family transcriptional regulator